MVMGGSIADCLHSALNNNNPAILLSNNLYVIIFQRLLSRVKDGIVSASFAAKINRMKFFPLSILLFISLGCFSQNGKVNQPKVPQTDASLQDLRFNLNNIMTLQLPSTYPDSSNGVVYKKTFSANFNRADSTTLEIPTLFRTVEKDSIFGGSRFYLPFAKIDVENLRIVSSPDGKFRAILLPAKKGTSFRLEPFGNVPEQQVEAVTIGWYDQVQNHTLDRAFIAWKLFLLKLCE